MPQAPSIFPERKSPPPSPTPCPTPHSPISVHPTTPFCGPGQPEDVLEGVKSREGGGGGKPPPAGNEPPVTPQRPAPPWRYSLEAMRQCAAAGAAGSRGLQCGRRGERRSAAMRGPPGRRRMLEGRLPRRLQPKGMIDALCANCVRAVRVTRASERQGKPVVNGASRRAGRGWSPARRRALKATNAVCIVSRGRVCLQTPAGPRDAMARLHPSQQTGPEGWTECCRKRRPAGGTIGRPAVARWIGRIVVLCSMFAYLSGLRVLAG